MIKELVAGIVTSGLIAAGIAGLGYEPTSSIQIPNDGSVQLVSIEYLPEGIGNSVGRKLKPSVHSTKHFASTRPGGPPSRHRHRW